MARSLAIPRLDDVYGGVFDIDQGRASKINFGEINSTLLFCDRIFVPDGFFHCYGPFSSHLIGEIDRASSRFINGNLISYLRGGFIVPVVRIGESPDDVWYNGKNDGVVPGEHLVFSKEEGDYLFGALKNEVIPEYARWPKEMDPKNSEFNHESTFATYLSQNLLDDDCGIPNDSGLDQLANLLPNIGVDAGEAREIVDGLSGLRYLIHENAKNKKFRRGDVEEFLRQQLGQEKFIYDRIYTMRGVVGNHFRQILNAVSSCYQRYQSDTFGISLHSGYCSDISIDLRSYTGKSIINESFLPYNVNLMPDINTSTLTYPDLQKIRNESPHIFVQVKELRNRLSIEYNENNFGEFLDFITNHYVPHIKSCCPNSVKYFSKNQAEFTYEIASRINDVLTVGGPIIGALSVGSSGVLSNIIAPEIVEKISNLLGTFGFSIALVGAAGKTRALGGFKWVDKMLIWPEERRAAANMFRRDIRLKKADLIKGKQTQLEGVNKKIDE